MSHMSFNDTDLDVIADLLRVAELSLMDLLASTHKYYPEHAVNETYRKGIERAQDLRAQIEGR